MTTVARLLKRWQHATACDAIDPSIMLRLPDEMMMRSVRFVGRFPNSKFSDTEQMFPNDVPHCNVFPGIRPHSGDIR